MKNKIITFLLCSMLVLFGTFNLFGAVSGGSGGISDISADTTPQLGGDLDANGNEIEGISEAEFLVLNDYAGIDPSANVQALLGAANYAAMKTLLDTDDIQTLTGIAAGTAHLGVFSGSTITDNVTIKAAIQALETYAEAIRGLGSALTGSTDTITSTGDVVLKLADNAGTNKLIVQDSDSAEVYSIDSNGAVSVGASASPTLTFNDSDNPGTDKEIGKILFNYIDGGDGSENGDWSIQAMQGGSELTTLSFDESDGQLETTIGMVVQGSFHSEKTVSIKVIADDTAVSVADGVAYYTVPLALNGYNLIDADVCVYTVSSSGTPTFQIHNLTDTQDMLSTTITVDASEFSSYTAATAPVINASYDDVATGDRLRFDCDAAGTGTAGTEYILVFELP